MSSSWDPQSASYAKRWGPGCAAIRWTWPQRVNVALVLGGMVLALMVHPVGTLAALGSLAAVGFLLGLLPRLAATLTSLVADPTLEVAPAVGDDLPHYTILVPLYHEADVIPGLVAALLRLEYPIDRLDIHLLLEPDDHQTAAAIAALPGGLPGHLRITTTPPGGPRTKPRACNAAFARLAPGTDLLVIFDAEDRPEPDQLRKAVAAYRQLPADVVCLQCRLGHYNARQSLVAGWSAVEYLSWFRYHLPGLQRLGAPIPLGGTSNHFRVSALQELGGWDPFNVTEDCDLGMRIARRGWRTALLASTTWEEAVVTPGAWVHQRSRWVKGYLQTWLVHTRSGAGGSLGPWRLAWMTATVGGSVLMHLVNPLAWLVMLAWLMLGWSLVDVTSVWSQVCLGITAFLVAANALFVAAYVQACVAAGRRDLLAAAVTMPVTWLLHSVAAWRAVYDFVVRPFHWAKTTHGHATTDIIPTLPEQRTRDQSVPMADGWAYRHRRVLAVGVLGILVALLGGVIHRGWTTVGADVVLQTDLQRPRLPVQEPLRAALLPGVSLVAEPPRQEGPWRNVTDPTAPSALLTGEYRVFEEPLTTPGSVMLSSTRMRDLADAQALAWDVWVPADAPPWMSTTVSVQDEDGRRFLVKPPQRLLPGQWTRLEVAMDQGWTPVGHQRPWSRPLRGRITALEFAAHGSQTWHGPLRMANLRTIPVSPGASGPLAGPIHASDMATVGERWEARVDLQRLYRNPFDPDEVALTGMITDPDGHEVQVPAFWGEDYQRRLVGDREVVEPTGTPGWRLRWRPTRAGQYQWRLRRRDASGEDEVAQGRFTAREATGPVMLPIIRAPDKPWFFATSDGKGWWPVGMNLVQPVDLRQAFDYPFPTAKDQGTFTYDARFARMAAAGMDWVRLWMTPWSFGLEGPPGENGFQGQGRYHLGNAWRLDHVLAEAARRGIRVQLTTMHHAELVNRGSWEHAAWNPRHGGTLTDITAFYRDPATVASYRKRLRYLVARWGDDPTITGWELFGEANLMPGYSRVESAAWHRTMADELSRLDLGRHLVFTHTNNWQAGHDLWTLNQIDIIQGNGYIRPPNRTDDHLINFDKYLAEVVQYRKPVLVAEYGARSEQGAANGDYLTAQIHSGLWASAVEPFAGSAMPWWWDYIDGANLYPHFAALQHFLAGIDRVATDYRTVRPILTQAPSGWRVAGQQADDRGFYWVHRLAIFSAWSLTRLESPPLEMTLTHLRPGRYRIRFMATDQPTDLGYHEMASTGTLTFTLPRILGDLGVRLDPIAEPL